MQVQRRDQYRQKMWERGTLDSSLILISRVLNISDDVAIV